MNPPIPPSSGTLAVCDTLTQTWSFERENPTPLAVTTPQPPIIKYSPITTTIDRCVRRAVLRHKLSGHEPTADDRATISDNCLRSAVPGVLNETTHRNSFDVDCLQRTRQTRLKEGAAEDEAALDATRLCSNIKNN